MAGTEPNSAALTQERITRLAWDDRRPANSKQILWDARFRGRGASFGVRVWPSGSKSYVLHFRTYGRSRLVSLGDIGDFHNATQAREHAEELRRRIRREKADPIAERALERAAPTVEILWDRYLDDRERGLTRRWRASPRTLEDLRSNWRRHIGKRFAKRKPVEVGRPEVRTWHRSITEQHGRYIANRCLQALRAMFNWAARQDDGTLPPGHANPCVGVALNPEEARRVYVEPRAMPALAAAIAQEKDPYVQAYFRLLILTGARKSELAGLRWADVELEGSPPRVTFRDTKNHTDHSMPLNDTAAALLEQLPRVNDNPFVFPGRVEGASIVGVNHIWLRIRARAGLPHVRIHDLRRTFGTLLASLGYSTQQIGKLLNHRSAITAEVYAEIADEARLRMVRRLDRRIQQIGRPAKRKGPTRAVA